MSVFTHFPSGGISIVEHISSGGWEIDKYSDGRWRGEYTKTGQITYTASNIGVFDGSGNASNSPTRTIPIPVGYGLKVSAVLLANCSLRGGIYDATASSVSKTDTTISVVWRVLTLYTQETLNSQESIIAIGTWA
ncbi:MAG: hypothetical protein LBJ91_02700 [Clostridiales Family XIII bacterium]|jgi:hypothetical protein|nr:hypothetical protein [Clostridiales Family XIII bacterium]